MLWRQEAVKKSIEGGFEFRTEFFNLFNHPPFSPPATGFNGTPMGNGFGQITSTVFGGGAAQSRLI